MKKLSFFVLTICLAFTSNGLSENNESILDLNQEKAVDEVWDLFGSSSDINAEQKTSEDMKLLSQGLKENYMYRRYTRTEINAIGESKEYFGMLEKNAHLKYIVEQVWDSYVLYSKSGKILEYRNFAYGQGVSVASKVGFKIKYFEKIGDALKDMGTKMGAGNSGFKGAVGSLLSKTGMLTSNEWTGVEAKKKLSDAAGNFQGVLEPSLFSNMHYLILYRLGENYPDKVIRITPEGLGFSIWSPLTQKQETEEEVRKGTILRSSYLIDKAILPDGKPAYKGDSWRVNANIFGDVLGLKTERRLQYTAGSVGFMRDQSDTMYKGNKFALLKLWGSEIDNKILLKTIPQKVKSGTKETITVHFIPEYGHVFWDFKDRQITLIEFKGKAEIQEYQEKDWWPDVNITVKPRFNSHYNSIIMERNILSNQENIKTIQNMFDLIEKIDLSIAKAIKEKI